MYIFYQLYVESKLTKYTLSASGSAEDCVFFETLPSSGSSAPFLSAGYQCFWITNTLPLWHFRFKPKLNSGNNFQSILCKTLQVFLIGIF